MIVLGVDPGSRRTGYGVLETDGRRHQLIEKGVIVPAAGSSLAARLYSIHAGLTAIIARTRPDCLAVEDLFHAVNTRTALVLGHVRGVILLAGAQAHLQLSEFPPATVKLQITGFGGADKAQVAMMVARLLDLPGPSEPGDAADALAVALCRAHLGPGLSPPATPPA